MKIKFTCLLVIISATCFGQVDTANIYSQALAYYNDFLEINDNSDQSIFIESTIGITEKLPQEIKSRQVVILTPENQLEVYSNNDDKLTHVRIFPAQLNNDLLEVQFTPYIGQYLGKKKGFSLSLSDWVIIQFKFNCREDRFEYWMTKTGGI